MIGYFGKIPAHGDFVSRGLPPSLLEAWDTWLQQCMLESQRQLGEQWLTHYLTSPVWRFAISPGILGPEGLGGVMMPSVDRVGRYFPLMVAATGAPPLLDWFQKQGAWYDEIEEMARASLDPAFRLEQFDTVPDPVAPADAACDPAAMELGRRLPLRGDAAQRIAAMALRGHSLWWTDGSPDADGSMLVCAGLPGPQGYSAMLFTQHAAETAT